MKLFFSKKIMIAVIIVLIVIFFHQIYYNENYGCSAIMIAKGYSPEKVSLNINGNWAIVPFTNAPFTFSGEISVDKLEYTQVERNVSLDLFFRKSKYMNFYYSSFLYSAPQIGTHAGGFLCILPSKEKFVFLTEHFDSNESKYMVIGPAESIEEAVAICKELGLENLLKEYYK